jgi:hypothetical protein
MPTEIIAGTRDIGQSRVFTEWFFALTTNEV